ncbi:Rif1 N domain-containing protein [Abeliophyllum distichum]|uniref:Rif1 N domain-containing protein n=1 Tax=Abeliophyllum distichum TaxID=126358 RepID=A0ABD1VCA6_9LAMI
MATSKLKDQIEEIKGLLSSRNKPLAYSKLLHFQQQSTENTSSIQILADSIHAILSSIVVDIAHYDEEIAAPALKCLGFMNYHPCILAATKGDDANAIIESLVKVITTTKIKSICNLGVWCISIQQFSESILAENFHSLLRAVIHALDNPIGSFSTTFEAMQAVVTLTSSLTEKMRELSNVWAPPIYRRLVSVDKRDRDISERCLLKIRFIISPPPLTLCKALVIDVKKKLLSAMKELMDQGMKIQSLQAWGWFIRLLGPYATKNKHLVNEMLKLLEQTFSDFHSPVQIASLVAWEGLIDALIEPTIPCPTNFVLEHDTQELRMSEGNDRQMEANGHLKRIKLIMKPLIGIMSSKCDVSVHASCLNTWSYLLHKLNTYISCQSVIKTVWEPIVEVIFQVGPEIKNIWLFNFCVDLLDTLILGRNKDETYNLHIHETSKLSAQSLVVGHLATGKCLLKNYPIKWSPWDLYQLDFFTKMIYILATQGSKATVTPEFRRLAGDAALRLFRSLLKAVNDSLKCASITYDEVMQCLNTILRFLGKLCANVTLEDSCIDDSCHTCLQFLEVASEGLESSILRSPLYKVALDLSGIEKLKPAGEVRSVTVEGICFINSMDIVSPVVYLSTLYFYVVVHSTLKAPECESMLLPMNGYLKFLLTLDDPLEVLRAFVGLLYKHKVFNCLKIWVVLANCLKDYIDGRKDLLVLNMELDNLGYSLVLYFLSYPFALSSFPQIKLELRDVIEPWKLLFVSVNHSLQSEDSPVKSFSEDLCSILNGFFDEVGLAVGTVENQGILLLYESVILYFLEQSTMSICCKGSKNMDCGGRISSNMKNSMELAARFMKLFLTKESGTPTKLSVPSRLLSALIHFVSCLHLREDIVTLIEAMSSPLLEWLSDMHLFDENANKQLRLLWKEILKSLCRSQPSVKFDSSFLKFQDPLLERTLHHPDPSISEPTINFWNASYGEQIKLEYPQNLVPVLDKLSRNGKINLCRRSHYREDSNTARQKLGVTATLNRCFKRVELMENVAKGLQYNDKTSLTSKRKRPELTEHQIEVRRAQQGRMMDCNGHGPGIRTYTCVDFSQGNEESQDSQDMGTLT